MKNGFAHFVRKVFARRKLLPGKFWVFAPLPLTRNLIRPLSVPFLFHSQAGLTAIWWEWSRDCFHVPSMLVIVVVYCCLNNVGKCYFFLHVFICCWWKTLLLFLFALKCTKHPTDSSLFPINPSLDPHPMGNREPYMVNQAPTETYRISTIPHLQRRLNTYFLKVKLADISSFRVVRRYCQWWSHPRSNVQF